MWLRYVLIPGISDKQELLMAMGEHFKDFNTVERVELQPYHKLGEHKWEALGWDYELKGVRENTEEEISRAKTILEPYFKSVVVN